MTYFPVFTPVQETNLKKLRTFCEAQSPKLIESAGSQTARALAKPLDDAADEERVRRIGELDPRAELQPVFAHETGSVARATGDDGFHHAVSLHGKGELES